MYRLFHAYYIGGPISAHYFLTREEAEGFLSFEECEGFEGDICFIENPFAESQTYHQVFHTGVAEYTYSS